MRAIAKQVNERSPRFI